MAFVLCTSVFHRVSPVSDCVELMILRVRFLSNPIQESLQVRVLYHWVCVVVLRALLREYWFEVAFLWYLAVTVVLLRGAWCVIFVLEMRALQLRDWFVVLGSRLRDYWFLVEIPGIGVL
jgi:hypothetical protein